MEGICTGKGSVIGINLTFGAFQCKTMGIVVCTVKLQKKKEVSAACIVI